MALVASPAQDGAASFFCHRAAVPAGLRLCQGAVLLHRSLDADPAFPWRKRECSPLERQEVFRRVPWTR